MWTFIINNILLQYIANNKIKLWHALQKNVSGGVCIFFADLEYSASLWAMIGEDFCQIVEKKFKRLKVQILSTNYHLDLIVVDIDAWLYDISCV